MKLYSATDLQTMERRKLWEQQRLSEMGVGSGKPGRWEPGTLFITDEFLPNEGERVAHGVLVQAAAESTGFRGPIQLRAFPSERYEVRYDPLPPDPNLPRRGQTYLKSLDQRVLENLQTTVGATTLELNDLNAAGVQNCVLNVSMATSQARVSETAYHETLSDFLDLHGAALALGLDEEKLRSADPAVFGMERARLQQAILERVDAIASQSPSLAQVKAEYAEAVAQFVAANNSLVVGGGNQGQVLERMQADSRAGETKVPESFFDSVLDHPQAIVVGATEDDTSLKPAAYSQGHRSNEIYASGLIGDGARGSSFASPRIAAVMADLHSSNPEGSSSDLEAVLVEELSEQAEGAPATVLDLNLARDFLLGPSSGGI